ncbi:MAG: CBS domain-containing protein [Erysipelotrichaceae bacterium]|nr:CBS domain-containing protein [Erysipelotrichaceae bacterium]
MSTADNSLFFLKPKASVCYLVESWTLRQALEKMRYHGYTALPVINERGQYVGTVSEGDFLWNLLDDGNSDIHLQEQKGLKELIRPAFNPAVSVSTEITGLIERIMAQNFVPVVDDQNVFMGIITRQDVIRYLAEKSR